ncbi:MAG TPA: PAS domain S-box protein, partial [Caldimonas sp.]|nr:PAS domain S-box protein [Caldimonas sp.]
RRIFVVNGEGDYLAHPDARRTFGFQLGHRFRWTDDLPELAAALGNRESGTALVHDATGALVGAAMSTVRPADGPRVAVIETVPYAGLMAPAAAVKRASLVAAVIAAACAIALAGLLARSLTRPLAAMTRAVESFAQDRPLAIPVGASGEIGALARAFARMVAEVHHKSAALEKEAEDRRRTEHQLARHAERERLYNAAVEFSNDAIVTKTLDGIITAWNPAAERTFGHSAQEAVGKSIELIVPDDRRAELRDILARISRGELIQHFETRRIAKDGRLLDISLSVSPVKSPAGEIIGAAKIARDITDRLRTRRALLQESEERRQIFDNSLDLILVTDRQGTFVSVSPSSLDILGYRPDEMVGHSAVEFILADDLENTRREMRMARKGRAMRNFECRYVHRDGRIVALTWSGVWSEPVQKHFFSGRDVTEQKLAEEELRDSERMARGVIDTALDAFVQMDHAGTIVDWNPQAEAVFGWLRAEAIGRTLAELIMPERRRPDFAANLASFLQSGERALLGQRFDLEAVRRDGKELKVELSLTALRQRGRHVFNGFIRDLTEQIAADEQRRQLQKMETVGQLTGGIAHDFNN